MSCFGNLARGAAEVQTQNGRNSERRHAPEIEIRTRRAHCACRFGAGAGSHRAGVCFQNFTGTLFQLVPYRSDGLAEIAS